MTSTEQLFLELIRVSLGNAKTLSRIPSTEEWFAILELSAKQALEGICYHGIRRLMNSSETSEFVPKRVFLQWHGCASIIIDENNKKNKQTKRLIDYFKGQGLHCSILKGQGIAALYQTSDADLSSLRQNGDIDIWIEGGIDKVFPMLQSLSSTVDFDYKHSKVPFFSDTEVEVHWRPDYFYYYPTNQRLQTYWKEHESAIYSGEATISDGVTIPVPTISLNRFYILLHCYRHLFGGGIGLRQIMDYYFVLLHKDEGINTPMNLLELRRWGSGFERFAGGMMWIMKELFGLSPEFLICSPNEKEGRFLLSEVMISGNFGQHDDRVVAMGWSSRSKHMLRNIQRGFHLISHYPSEVIWNPLWLMGHFVWKRCKKYTFNKRNDGL